MEFSEVVHRRRMVRNYDPDRPVPTEIRDRILRNGLRAPSAGFTQGWAFLVLETAADRARFWAATSPDPAATTGWLTRMSRAPLIVVPMSHQDAYLDRYAEPDKGRTDRDAWSMPYWHIDTGFAALTMLLTVVDEDLGACFFGIPGNRVSAFRREFGVPGNRTPIGAITIGYRAPDPRSPSLRRGRRPPAEVLHFGQW